MELGRGADMFLDLKRELISQQVNYEITELSSPTALQRFGAPFRSEYGEVAPVDSDLPLLRYIFVHHVRKFPFLDQAKEKEFWQDKLQIVGRSFEIASCHTSLTSMVVSSFLNPSRTNIYHPRKTVWRRRSDGSLPLNVKSWWS